MPGIYDAAPSVLSCIDRVQSRLICEIGMSEKQALEDFRLAPLCARRGMAMLGVFCTKSIWEQRPNSLVSFFV